MYRAYSFLLRSLSNILFLCRKIFVFLLSCAQYTYSYETQHLTSRKLQYNVGLYFEDVSDALFYSHEWKLFTTLNLTYYDEEYKSFAESMSKIFATCDLIKFRLPLRSAECDKSLSHLKLIVNNIDHFKVSTTSGHHKIVKRGYHIAGAAITITASFAIGFAVSYFSNNQDEAHYNKLSAIISNNEERDTILNEQTTYINSISDVVANGTNNLNDYLNLLANKSQIFYNKIGEFSNEFSKQILRLEIKALIHDIVSIATVVIINFQRQQQTLNHFLSISSNSRNNPFIFPPTIFFRELTIIRKLAEKENFHFPFELNTDNLPLFYQISTVKATLMGTQLMLTYSVPLIKLSKFVLYKITTVPIQINNTVAAYIIPKNDFIAIDSKSKKYLLLGKTDIEESNKLGNLYIFKLSMPIADFMTVRSCEINIFKSEPITNECDVRLVATDHENWIALAKPNTWIFSPFGNQRLRLDCFNNYKSSEYFYIDEISIVNISSGCQIFSDKFTLTAFQTYSSSFVQPVQKNIKFSLQLNETINTILSSEHEIESVDFGEIIPNFDRDKLLKIFHDSTRLKQKIKNIRSSPSMYTSNIGIKEILFIVLIFFLAIITLKTFIHLVKIVS